MTRPHLAVFLAAATLLIAGGARSETAAPTIRLAQTQPSVYSGPGRCTLEVEGRKYLDGRCQIEQAADTMRVLPPAGQRIGYFGYLIFDDANTASGYWNGEPGANHAEYRLGTMRRDGHCWVGARSRICAAPMRQ